MSSSRRLKLPLARQVLAVGFVSAVIVTMAVAPAQAGPVPPPVVGTISSTNPADYTPHAQNGDVRAYAQIGDTVFVGGTFTSIKNSGAAAWTARGYLFAYNRTNGQIIPGFAPTLDGGVNALEVSPTGKLIVGGAFKNVNGVSRKNLVAVEPDTGATVATWNGRGDGGTIRALAVHGNWLYVSGAFGYINSTGHALFARVNASTGAIDTTFQINASVPRVGGSVIGWTMAISPDGNTLVGGGNFTEVNGQPRNQIFVAENLLTAPAVADWSTQKFVPPCYNWAFAYYVQDIDFSDDGSYFAVGANGGREANAYCDAVSRWETSARGSSLDATWVDYTGTDTVTSVEATEGVIYTGGHFRWMNNANGNDAAGPGAIDRYGIAALDPSNGVPFNWNPTRSPGGATLPPGGKSWGAQVNVIWKGSDGIYVGQDSDGLGNEYHGRMGLFPAAGGRTIPAANAPTATSGYLYVGGTAGQLTKVALGPGGTGAVTTPAQPNIAGIGAAFMVSNRLYWSKTDAAAPSGRMVLSSLSGSGEVSASWLTSYSAWFQSGTLNGAFALNGRMYYVRNGSNNLYFRYLEHDGNTFGCTEFTVPTQNVTWTDVRGLTWADGKIYYGSTDGNLRSVAFDDTAAPAAALDGATATVVSPASAGVNWSNKTLYFATS